MTGISRRHTLHHSAQKRRKTGRCSSLRVRVPPSPRASVKSGASRPSGRTRGTVVVAAGATVVVAASATVVAVPEVGAVVVAGAVVVTSAAVVAGAAVVTVIAAGAPPQAASRTNAERVARRMVV